MIVLVTGVSAAGKTAVATQLEAWGQVAVSLDGYEGLCTWADHDGLKVARPKEPGRAFLASHERRWRPPALDKLLRDVRSIGVNTVWLTGIAANLPQLRDRFDWIILLRIDESTMRSRLQNTKRVNDFGTVGDTLEHLSRTFASQQRQLESLCDTSIDATDSITAVAENPLSAPRFRTLPSSVRPALVGLQVVSWC